MGATPKADEVFFFNLEDENIDITLNMVHLLVLCIIGKQLSDFFKGNEPT